MVQSKRGGKMKKTNKLRYLCCIALLLLCFSTTSLQVSADEADEYPIEEYYGDGSGFDFGDMQQEPETTYLDGRLAQSEVDQLVAQSAQILGQLFLFNDEEYSYLEKQYAGKEGYEGVFETYEELKTMDKGKVVISETGEVDTKNIEVLENDDDTVDILYDLPLEKGTVTIDLKVACYEHLGNVHKNVTITERDSEKKSAGKNEKVSMLDKLKEAGANTLMGMGTVFTVLIFMSLIISCFGLIPIAKEKFGKKDKKSGIDTEVNDQKVVQEQIVDTELEQGELIAVIAAAIAASEQKSTDSFVVRSIKRR